ncbi:GNAT family N-acetyltransferase [[Clostridium] innocuum]|nr:GNAT family N-acetyltransferase [[Clostridium] innocuum]
MDDLITIQPVEMKDIKELAALEACCFPKEEAADEQALRQRACAFPDSFLVMKRDGAVIGMINGCVSNASVIHDEMYADVRLHEPEGRYQTVFGLDVHPDVQHRGYAQMLMHALIERAKQANRAGLVLTCKEQLVSFYKQFGFQNMGVSASVHGGAVWYDMLLKLA